MPITYRLAFLPLRARKPHRPPWPLGKKDESEGRGAGGEQGWVGMGPYSQDPLGGQGRPGYPGKQQLRR